MSLIELVGCFTAGALLFSIALRVERRSVSVSAGCMLAAFLAPAYAAYRGMDFSPSFTMYFVLFETILCGSDALILFCLPDQFPYAGPVKTISRYLYTAGIVFSFPAVFIYAAGSDYQNGCILLALIVSVAVCAARLLILHKEGSTIAAHTEFDLWLTLLSAVMTVSCSLESTALLPYGAGLLCLAAVQPLSEKTSLRCFLSWIGLSLTSLFAAVPALH